jgi:hypothetical protein
MPHEVALAHEGADGARVEVTTARRDGADQPPLRGASSGLPERAVQRLAFAHLAEASVIITAVSAPLAQVALIRLGDPTADRDASGWVEGR